MKTILIAKALTLDASGNILILERGETHPTLPNHPDLPGGLVEKNEDFSQAVIREIYEETGLRVSQENLEPVYAGTEIKKNENRVRFLFCVRLDTAKPKVKLSWEHSRADWVPLGELSNIETKFHSFYKDALHHIRVNRLV